MLTNLITIIICLLANNEWILRLKALSAEDALQIAGVGLGLADDALVPTGPEQYPRDAPNRPELYQSEYRLLATYSDWLRVYDMSTSSSS